MDFHNQPASPNRRPPYGLGNIRASSHRLPPSPELSNLVDEAVEGVLEEVSDFLQAQYPETAPTPATAEPAPESRSDDPSGAPETQRDDPVAQRVFGLSPTLRNVCQGTTVAGEPCRSFARNGADFCFMHDPASADEADAARSNGAARVNALRRFEAAGPLSTVEELRDFSSEILKAAAAGHLTPQALHALQQSLAQHNKLISDAHFAKRYYRS